MARIRTIKPEMAHSVPLSRIPREVLTTWVMLWPQCDDEGRYAGDPRLVWAAIYPLRDDIPPIQLSAELELLAEQRRLCCYRGCDGKVWLHVLGWHHQKIDRPSRSRIPPCRFHEPDAECAVHDKEPCESAPARFTDAEPVSSEDPQRVGRLSRASREELASTDEVARQDAPVSPDSSAIRERLASDSRYIDAVPRTVDRGPRTVDQKPGAASPPPGRRGTRIPEPFVISDDMRTWARGEGFADAWTSRVTESFVDYWRAKAGSGGVKLDWASTWRNWLRREAERTGSARSPTAVGGNFAAHLALIEQLGDREGA